MAAHGADCLNKKKRRKSGHRKWKKSGRNDDKMNKINFWLKTVALFLLFARHFILSLKFLSQ